MPGLFDSDDFALQLEYMPDDYMHYAPEREGRWRTFSRDGKLQGVIWTDGAEGAGFLNGDEDNLPGTSDAGMSMLNMFRILKQQGVPASTAYLAMQQTPGATLGSEQTGTLKDAMELANSLKGDVDEASASGADYAINAAFTLDEEEFIDLLRSDTVGLFVYDGGEWGRIPDEDDTFDGTEWIELTDAGVKRAQELLTAGETPTRDEMLKFSVDN